MSRSATWPRTGFHIPAQPDGTATDQFRHSLLRDPDQAIYRFLQDGEGEPVLVRNDELDRRARALAHALSEHARPGDRAIIVCPPGLDYLTCFFACLYSGVIAVPVYPPEPPYAKRTLPRLEAIIADSRPDVLLATRSVIEELSEIDTLGQGVRTLVLDDLDCARADDWRRPDLRPDDVAFLQYTSGSTSAPKGVMVTQRNLVANVSTTHRAFFGEDEDPGRHLVIWLPPYHDMGLIGGLLQPVFASFPVTVMTPMAFLKRPERWLWAMSNLAATTSGGPNFAYELCVSRFDERRYEGLDLSHWSLAFNGAEPIRADTMARFAETFAPYGFRREALFPCYGLAESTLMVTSAGRLQGPVDGRFDGAALAEGRGVPSIAPDASVLVSSGTGAHGQRLEVVDPSTCTAVAPGEVGEIWTAGDSVAAGYWGHPAASEETFGATLSGDETRFLRTGDLGFLQDGQLFVTGRAKDLIIVGGRNHYPQDLELSVVAAHPDLRADSVLATSLEAHGASGLLIACEVLGSPDEQRAAEIGAAVRQTVLDHHGLAVDHVALLRRGGLPKTSSGKLQRRACGQAFLAGELRTTHVLSAAAAAVPAAAPEASPPDAAAPEDPAAHPAAPESRTADAAALEDWLVDQVSRRASLTASEVDVRTPLVTLGLGSVELMGLLGDLEQHLGREIDSTVVWEHPTVADIAAHLTGTEPEPATPHHPATSLDHEPIAVVGIGCRFPGGVEDPDGFWRMLLAGRDAITEVPGDRWDADAFFDEDQETPGRATTRWGGFLSQVDHFDHTYFGISPREAQQMDPQQRILSEVTAQALDDAGLRRVDLAGSPTGVFVGISSSDYTQLALADLRTVNAFTGTGNAHSIAANRLSYLFDLHGPSLAIDTACSSSLVAVHQAVRALRSGECSMAVAGGVNVILSPALSINFSKAGAMAADGRCKAFDARADGYVRGEGAGAVVLKPLSAARRDGDRVYATILGSAVNQDGRSNGLMAPSPRAQEDVLRAACADAGVAPGHVVYVEAHGTGTLLGDPIEVKALGSVMRGDGGEPLLVGSVKTNIGHLESAAGIAGLIKSCLALKHGELPPSLHFQEPNPHIDFEGLSVAVVAERRALPEGGLVGISSFGFGGTNSHLVLTSEVPAPMSQEEGTGRPLLLLVSAHGAEALRAQVRAYAVRLAGASEAEAAAVCSAAALRRDHLRHRKSFSGTDVTALLSAMRAWLDEADAPPAPSSTGTVLAFSGQGPRWWPVDRSRLQQLPAASAVLDRAADWLRKNADLDLWGVIGATADDVTPRRTSVAQPVLCALQVALAEQWLAWGLRPVAVVGHSVGEIAAACAAGAIGLEDALTVTLARGRALEQATGGRMAVVGATRTDLTERVAAWGLEDVWVSATNSPTSTVLSGSQTSIAAVLARCEADGVFARALGEVTFASHCPLMDPVLHVLRDGIQDVRAQATRLTMVSSVHAETVSGEELGPDYWVTNLREPVRFDDAVRRATALGANTFVEVSGHPMLGIALGELLQEGAGGTVTGSLHRDSDPLLAMQESVGSLYDAGVDLDATARGGDVPAPMVSLPARAWTRSRHWLPSTTPRNRTAGHPYLEHHVRSGGAPAMGLWSGTLCLDRQPDLGSHRVSGAPVLPAAAVIDLALFGARTMLDADDVALLDVHLHEMVLIEESSDVPNLLLEMTPATAQDGSFVLRARRDGADWREVATGRWQSGGGAVPVDTEPPAATGVDADDLYRRLAASGLEYTGAFRALEDIAAGPQVARATLACAPTVRADAATHSVHPALLDAAFQAIGAVVDGAATGPRVPTGLRRCRLLSPGRIPARTVVSDVSQERDGTVTADVLVLDAASEPLLHAEGLVLSPIGGQGLDPLLTLGWSRVELPPAQPGRWVVVALQGATAERLRAVVGAESTVLLHADAPGRLDEHTVTCDLTSPDQVDAALRDIVVTSGRPDGVLCAHALDLSLDDDADATDPVRDLGCLPVVGVARALTTLEAPVRLAVLTSGALRARPADAPPRLGQAAVIGFVRSLLSEHPDHGHTLVDLDPAEDTAPTDLLAALAPTSPGQLAQRGGAWFVPGLVAAAVPGEPEVIETKAGEPATGPDTGNGALLAARPGALDSVCEFTAHRRAPRAGEVEVRVLAAGLNFSDVLKAMDSCPGVPPGRTPLGAELSGEVVRVGTGVTDLSPGDVVMGIAGSSMSRYVTTGRTLLTRVPEGISPVDAAALPIAYLTVLYALETLGRLESDESLLVHSATGGVGLAALSYARHVGAEVYATAGTDEKRDLLRSVGVTHVMSSRSLDFADQVLKATGGRGVDVVLNSLAGSGLTRSLDTLADNGRFLEIGKHDVYADSHLGMRALRRNRSFLAVDLEALITSRPDRVARLLARLVELLADGSVSPLPVTTFPFSEAADAFATLARARHTGKIVLVPDPATTRVSLTGTRSRQGTTALVTGGLGALGRHLATELVADGVDAVVLVGRSAPSVEAEETLARLRETGAAVEVRLADVADPAAVRDLVADVAASFPPLRSVFHVAGTLDDAPLTAMDRRRLAHTWEGKAAGAWNLHRATSGLDLDEFVLYSSAAGLMGTPGQANYAAANCFLDALAEHRLTSGLPALSIGWGPWADSGLAARQGSDDSLATYGITPITASRGTDLLSKVLPRSGCIAALDLDRPRLEEAGRVGLLPEIMASLIRAAEEDVTAESTTELRDELLALPPGRLRHQLLADRCRAEIAAVLRADVATVSTDVPVTAMGFDSLMGLELRKRLERSVGVPLPSTVSWRFPTVDALVPFLAEQMEVDLSDDAAPEESPTADVPVERRATPPATELPDDLEELSEADLEALLLETLDADEQP